MKLGLIKRIDKGDLAKGGGEIPGWIDGLMDPLNQFIEKVGLALQNRLSFVDNFLGKEFEAEFTDSTELEINPFPDSRGSLRVRGVIPLTTGQQYVTAWKWTQKSNGNIGVTFKFDGATSATIRIQILLG